MRPNNFSKLFFILLLSGIAPLFASSQVYNDEVLRDSLIQAMNTRIEESMIKVGEKLPFAELRMLDGTIKSTNYYNGKPTLLFLWDVNCDRCIRSMPGLNLVKAKLGDKYQYLSLINEERMPIKATLYDHPFDFDHAIPPESYTSQLGFQTVSQLVVIDKYGELLVIVPHLVFDNCLIGHDSECANEIHSYIQERVEP